MAENKTKPNQADVADFLERKATPQQQADCRQLLKLFKRLTGKPAKMWGPSIVGFGSYHYVYPSGREGDAPLIGFSPRGKEIVMYLGGDQEDRALLRRLGKHRAGVGCVYIKSLADVDLDVLKELAQASIDGLRRRYPDRKER